MPEQAPQPETQDLPDTEMEEPEDYKRKGPDSRTVVLAPEKKKQKIDWTSRELLHQRSLWWMLQRPKKYVLEPHSIWYMNLRWDGWGGECHQWSSPRTTCFTPTARRRTSSRSTSRTGRSIESTSRKTPWQKKMSCDTGRFSKLLIVKNYVNLWTRTSSARSGLATWRKELRWWTQHGSGSSKDCRMANWLQRANYAPGASWTLVKSYLQDLQQPRVCPRGSWWVQLPHTISSWLHLTTWRVRSVRQGLHLKRKSGKYWPNGELFLRKVVVVPPPNTWRQLAHFDQNFNIPEESFGKFGLLCQKPAYGLNDAPLAWQMSLQETLEEGGGVQSLLDECLWHFKFPDGRLQGLISTHVDDLAIASGEQFLMEQQRKLNSKYGSIKAQRTCTFHPLRVPIRWTSWRWLQDRPAEFCGLTSMPGDHRRRWQLATSHCRGTHEVSKCSWWTSLADCNTSWPGCWCQHSSRTSGKSHCGRPVDGQLCLQGQAKAVLYGMGLTYRRFSTSTHWRLLAIHDASAAAKGRNYAQEGVIILLAPDHLRLDWKIHTDCGTDVNEEIFGGPAHILYAHGAKAKRICYNEPCRNLGGHLRPWNINAGEFATGWDSDEGSKTHSPTTCSTIQGGLLASRQLHRLQGLRFFDHSSHSFAPGQKPEDLHPCTSRSQNQRPTSMDHSDPNRQHDCRSVDQGDVLKATTWSDGRWRSSLLQQGWSPEDCQWSMISLRNSSRRVTPHGPKTIWASRTSSRSNTTPSTRSTWSTASSTRMNLCTLRAQLEEWKTTRNVLLKKFHSIWTACTGLHLVSHDDGDFLPDLRFVLDQEDVESAQKLHSDPNVGWGHPCDLQSDGLGVPWNASTWRTRTTSTTSCRSTTQ